MKNVYELLNDVVMPAEYEDREELSYLERARIKKRLRAKLGMRKKPYMKIAAVGMISFALIYAFIPTDVKASIHHLASKIPIVRGILDLYVGQPAEKIADYKTTIGQTVSDNGIDVRLDEILLDTGRLLISSTFHSTEVNLESAYPEFPTIYINNRDVMENGGGGGGQKTKIDGQTYSYITTVDLDDVPTGPLKIQIAYNGISLNQGKETIKGNWGFTVESSAEKILGDTQTIPINKSFRLDNGQEVEIDHLTLSPVSTKIDYKILKGTDYDVHFEVRKSDGTLLKPVSASTAGVNNFIRFPELDESTDTITVIPYVISGKEGEGDPREPKKRKYLYEEQFDVDVK